MAYTTVNKSTDYFNTKLYTGNGSTQSITGVGFQPDWLWIKNRGGANNNILQDAVRGATKSLESDGTGAETTSATRVTSFDSDGFSIGSAGTNNTNTNDYVSWNWKANGQGSANSDGSITTTYTSVNTTSGFSISTYTGTGSNATIGHGLGVKPSMIICKRLNSTGGWISYHSALGATKYLYLDNTDTEAANSIVWQDTEPTTSVFSVGTASNCNASGGTYVAYCFAEKTGFSKFGLYEGNGNADGPFVYTGFKPAFIMLKGKGIARNWTNWDNARDIFNPHWNYIYPNLADAGTNIAHGSSGSYAIDFLSNGFKLKNTDDKFNGNGQGYIYMCFAAAPLVGSNNVPATAR